MFIDLPHQASSLTALAPMHTNFPLFFPPSPQYYYLGSTATKTQMQQPSNPVAELNYKMIICPTGQNILILETWNKNTKLKYFCLKENLTPENSLKEL